ncbi:5'-nucleotidase C-terminal domain-containing protein [Pseudoneobacillus sp. C159]
MAKIFQRSKKWISVVLTAILLLAMVAPNVSANTAPVSLAKWDFSGTNKLVPTTAKDANKEKALSYVGPASLTYSGGPQSGVTVPNASNWTANPSYWAVPVSTKGYENITLSSKQYSSTTGPRDFKVQYSLDNTTWTDVPGSTVATKDSWTFASGILTDVALPSETKDKDVVYVRWIKTSEKAASNTGDIASGGTSRIGLIEFKGTAIPTTPTEPQPDPNAVPGQGKVTLNGQPLTNLTFSVKETTTGEWSDIHSDANGVFEHGLADGTYNLAGLWVAPTWYPLNKTFTLTNGLENGLKELTIEALEYDVPTADNNVVGKAQNGATPLAHLTFSLHSTTGDWYAVRTDRNGKFALTLPNGSYQIDGIWDDAKGKWYELNQVFTVTAGKLDGAELVVDIASVYNDNVTGTLSKGTAKLANQVFAIRTVELPAKWYAVTTDASGNFSLRLPSGEYFIEGIWVAGEAKWYETQTAFTAGATATQVNIDVVRDSVNPLVTGKLTKNGNALGNIEFSVRTKDEQPNWYAAKTDATGNYGVHLPKGTYVLEGIWLGAESKWYELNKEFTVNGPTTFDIPLVGEVSKFNLSIMHTNDTHANVDNATNNINVAKRMTAIKSVRADHPDALLLDAGDVLTGTLYFNEYKGLADLEFMNLAKYDAMTFGNHEFDMGTALLANFVKGAQFPFVSANVNFTNDTNLNPYFHDNMTATPEGGQIYNGIVKEINGEKIGIFGLTTAETPTISSPGAGVVFEDYLVEAQKSVDAFKALGINKIVALTHIGYDDSLTWDNDLELAKQVEGIDVIVGGHTHTKLDKPVFDRTGEEPTVIVQANEYNKFLGTLNVTFDEAGKVIIDETSGSLLDITKYTEDPATLEILNTKYKPTITAKEKTVVGTAAVDLVGGNPPARVGETNLGNFIADGMLAKAQTINPDTLIAVQNGGGVRTTLKAGDVTLANVFQVLPFGNSLGIMNLKGSELKEALEYAVKDAPLTAFGGFLQVSGLKVQYDSTKPVGQKIVSIQVKGKDGSYTALDVNKNYFVATNVFTAKGGDGFTMFGKAYTEGRVSEPGFVDWEMFLDHISAQPNKIINPSVEGRIVNVAPTVVTAANFSGTVDNIKVHTGNILVDVTGVTKLEYAHVTGNLTLKGNNGVELNNVEVDGDTIFE